MVDWYISLLVEMVHSFDNIHDLLTLLCYKAIVIGSVSSNMNCEFLDIFAWRDCFRHSNNVCERNYSLYRFLVDIVESVVCNYEGTLLCPLEHVGFFNLSCIYELI